MKAKLVRGDCRVVMAAMEADSVDAVVTDPPYGLEFMGREWDRLDGGLPQENVWKGRRGKGGGSIGADDSKPASRHRVSLGGSTRSQFKRCTVCGKRAFSGSPCKCADPQWVIEHVEGPPSSSVRMQRWHETWAVEAFRVLKPGAHLVAFGGTRTFHRMMVAIEDAGFEIRDTIGNIALMGWVHSQGFPKSLDVGKAIDKKRDDCADVLAVTKFVRSARDCANKTNTDIDAAFSTNGMAGHWTSAASQPAVPTWDQWLALKSLLEFGDEMDAEVWRLNGRKGKPGDAWFEREVIREKSRNGRPPQFMWGDNDGQRWNETSPATDLARQWDGWGTALKPAWEPIILARKPLIGTVAANVVAHGTGGINVDGCRIGTTVETWPKSRNYASGNMREPGMSKDGRTESAGDAPSGRWPANLILSHTSECREVGVRRVKGARSIGHNRDGSEISNQILGARRKDTTDQGYAGPDGRETVAAWDCARDPETGEYVCPVALLDQMSGERTSNSKPGRVWRTKPHESGSMAGSLGWDGDPNAFYGDTGGASRFFLNVPPDDPATRFFYAPKASRAERNRGLEGMPERSSQKMGDGLRSMVGHPSGNNGNTSSEDRRAANHHPTVKPLALMRWLVRLVAPPGGLVCDIFCGSGTTGVACALEGFDFLGIDEDAEGQGYIVISERRIADAMGPLFANVEVVW